MHVFSECSYCESHAEHSCRAWMQHFKNILCDIKHGPVLTLAITKFLFEFDFLWLDSELGGLVW